MRHNHPPNDDDSTLVSRINDVVQYQLESRDRILKNGETWQSYLFRTFTLDRIALGILLIYNLGGNINEARTSIQNATARAVTASTQAEVASKKADQAIDDVRQVKVQLEVAIEELKRQAAINSDVVDHVKQNVSRVEFNAMIRQQILPRLERIEKKP